MIELLLGTDARFFAVVVETVNKIIVLIKIDSCESNGNIIYVLPCCMSARGEMRDLPEAGVAGLKTRTTPLRELAGPCISITILGTIQFLFNCVLCFPVGCRV